MELTEYLKQRIAYYKNQNLILDNKERMATSDYEWIKHNNDMLADLKRWIKEIEGK